MKKPKQTQKKSAQTPGKCRTFEAEIHDSNTGITILRDPDSGDGILVGKNGIQDATVGNAVAAGMDPLDAICTPGLKNTFPDSSKDAEDPDLPKDFDFV